jgi:hypothetical protein
VDEHGNFGLIVPLSCGAKILKIVLVLDVELVLRLLRIWLWNQRYIICGFGESALGLRFSRNWWWKVLSANE